MEPDVSFVGIKLLPGKPVAVNDDGESESQIWTLHITQFALAKQPRAGRNVVSLIKEDGEAFVLGTLEKGRCEQFTADLMVSESARMVVEGESEVHLTGYKTTTELLDPEAEELLGDSESEEESEDEDYEAELQRQVAGEEDEDDDDEEEDEDEEAPNAVPLLTAKQAAQMERKLAQAGLHQAAGEGESDEEDDIDEEDLEEDEEEEGLGATGLAGMDADEESSEEEEEEQKAPPKKAKRPAEKEAKRPAAATPAAAAKKAKTAAAATPGGEGAGDAQWLKDIRAHIAKEGPTSLSSIGSSVKKPPGTAKKLKKLLEESPAFTVGADLVVSLAKK